MENPSRPIVPSATNLFMRGRRVPPWLDNVQARVALSLILLIFLAIPAFLLMVENRHLIVYYLIYPALASLALYLRYRGKVYLSNAMVVLSAYGIILWMASLVGFKDVNILNWWIISLLPWVMFSERQRLGLWLTAPLPIIFSLLVPYLPMATSLILPAEQDFIKQILRISVALGAFSCIFYMRQYYAESEKLRGLENEFYSNTLDTIPLPIIIKDGITLDFVFFNQAAQLTYDLSTAFQNSNTTTFSESCAAMVSRLDQEVLRSVAYHVEPDENLVHQTGLHWHFRTYRIPLELKSSGRRLLITISEDLRALNLVMRKAEQNKEMLGQIFHFVSPLLIRFNAVSDTIIISNPPEWAGPAEMLAKELIAYLEYHIAHHPPEPAQPMTTHKFPLAGRNFLVYYGAMPATRDFAGIVIEIKESVGLTTSG